MEKLTTQAMFIRYMVLDEKMRGYLARGKTELFTYCKDEQDELIMTLEKQGKKFSRETFDKVLMPESSSKDGVTWEVPFTKEQYNNVISYLFTIGIFND